MPEHRQTAQHYTGTRHGKEKDMGEAKRIDCDVLVVGGGINGAGIARDAAGRGLRVVLCEKDDLAQHTSSASSKLIHGGLRYLEHYEFSLVRKALAEREVLLKSAPHITHPLRFVMPHATDGRLPGQRPAWMIRTGLFLYDHLAHRDFLPGSEGIDLRAHPDTPAALPLQRRFARAFVYSDAWVDDARLVVLAAVDGVAGEGTRALRLVKGSHIVVPRLFAHDQAYILQQPDGRIVFAIPYEGAFTLIGTTDVEYDGDLDRVAIAEAETAYLCEAANRCFERSIAPADVVWSYAGVRPLIDGEGGVGGKASASAASRDYRLETDTHGAPLLSVFGGKVTTFRKLAEDAVDWIAPLLGRALPGWTAHACLPGGDLYGKEPDARSVLEFDAWLRTRQQHYAWLPPALLARYARAYGTRLAGLLAHCRTRADLGEEVVPGLFEVELDYLWRHEWALGADDVLWRRTKLGLHAQSVADPGAAARVAAWLARRGQGKPVAVAPGPGSTNPA
jgi:glycerol-3-phosphate dehydrogenase